MIVKFKRPEELQWIYKMICTDSSGETRVTYYTNKEYADYSLKRAQQRGDSARLIDMRDIVEGSAKNIESMLSRIANGTTTMSDVEVLCDFLGAMNTVLPDEEKFLA